MFSLYKIARDSAICRKYSQGATMRQVAREFDLSLERVRQILRREQVHIRKQGSGR